MDDHINNQKHVPEDDPEIEDISSIDTTDDIDELKGWYCEEIRKRDSIIDGLKKKNSTLFEVALESSRKMEMLKDKLSAMEKKLGQE